MGSNELVSVTMGIDSKRYGIRIHKSLYRQLGQPDYIQLLVNPQEGIVAIRSVDRETVGGQVHRIDAQKMSMDSSYEIYSRSFIKKLLGMKSGFEEDRCYRLRGKIYPSSRAAVFPLESLKLTER